MIAAAAVALLVPATAGAAKIRYGIKSAEFRVHETAEEHWDGGERYWGAGPTSNSGVTSDASPSGT